MAGKKETGVPEGSNRWLGRPIASRVLRVGIIAVPVVVSFTSSWILSSLTAVPSTIVGAVVRWLLIAAAATVVLVAVERLTRRLAPMATLLALSLTFPDRAPPRLRLALRNGSMRQLQDRIAEAGRGELGGTPAEAAERVLELVAALSVHDRTTRGHSERVRAYSRMIGEQIGLDDVELDQLQWAGLLHDIGKLLISSDILNKPGKLTAEEYAEVCLHPGYGRGMVTPLIPWLGDSARAVWEHHERWDGRGYPSGLAGTNIALPARIVAVADTFDVMTSVRSYKTPASSADARTELARCAGGQFDQTIVRAFLNISIGRLRLIIGPLSWLSQIPLFPTSVLTSAVGSHAATLAAVLAVVSPVAVGLEGVHAAPGPVAKNANGSELAVGLTAEPISIGEPVTTSGATGIDPQDPERIPPSTDANSPLVPPSTPSTPSTSSTESPPGAEVPSQTAPPPAARVTPSAPTSVVTRPSTPVATEPPTSFATQPSTPVATHPSTSVATHPSGPVVTQPPVPGTTHPSVPGTTQPSVPGTTQPPVPAVTQPPVPVVTQPPVQTASVVDLGVAAGFAVLGKAAVTSTGPTSITGHIGATTLTGLTPAEVTGQITSASVAAAAHAAALAAQLFLDGLTASPLPGVELGGRTITPGVYHGGTIELTGTVVLDAGGDPNALFVLKAASTLVTASASRVVLANGAQACNVFWEVGSSATFGTTTQFAGTVIAKASITATTGASFVGRLIARNGAVTLDSNTIVVPACG